MNLQMPIPYYLYLLCVPSYSGKDRSKIGVSKNPKIRVRQLRSYCCGPSDIHKIWVMPDRQSAFAFENEVNKKFTRAFYGKQELFDEPPKDVLKFINERLKELEDAS